MIEFENTSYVKRSSEIFNNTEAVIACNQAMYISLICYYLACTNGIKQDKLFELLGKMVIRKQVMSFYKPILRNNSSIFQFILKIGVKKITSKGDFFRIVFSCGNDNNIIVESSVFIIEQDYHLNYKY